MKRSEVQKAFLKMVENIVFPKGFDKLKTNEGYEYRLKTNDGFFSVTPFVNQYDTLFFVSLGFQLRIDEVSDILVSINNISNDYKDSYPTLSFGIDSFFEIEDKRIKVESADDLVKAITLLGDLMKNKVMVFFQTYSTLFHLDKDMNRDNRPKDLYTSDREFIGLIAAVLNRNPQVKYWENYYRNELQNVNQYTRNQFEKLVVYLNENYPKYESY